MEFYATCSPPPGGFLFGRRVRGQSTASCLGARVLLAAKLVSRTEEA